EVLAEPLAPRLEAFLSPAPVEILAVEDVGAGHARLEHEVERPVVDGPRPPELHAVLRPAALDRDVRAVTEALRRPLDRKQGRTLADDAVAEDDALPRADREATRKVPRHAQVAVVVHLAADAPVRNPETLVLRKRLPARTVEVRSELRED